MYYVYTHKVNRTGHPLGVCQNVPVRPSSTLPPSTAASLCREAEEGLLRPIQNYTDICITRDHHYIEPAISKQSSNSPQAQHNHDYHHRGSNLASGRGFLFFPPSLYFFSFFPLYSFIYKLLAKEPSSSNACPRRLHAVSYIIRCWLLCCSLLFLFPVSPGWPLQASVWAPVYRYGGLPVRANLPACFVCSIRIIFPHSVFPTCLIPCSHIPRLHSIPPTSAAPPLISLDNHTIHIPHPPLLSQVPPRSSACLLLSKQLP